MSAAHATEVQNLIINYHSKLSGEQEIFNYPCHKNRTAAHINFTETFLFQSQTLDQLILESLNQTVNTS